MNDTVTQPVVSCSALLQLSSQEEGCVDEQHSQSATAAASSERSRRPGKKGATRSQCFFLSLRILLLIASLSLSAIPRAQPTSNAVKL